MMSATMNGAALKGLNVAAFVWAVRLIINAHTEFAIKII